MTDAPDYPYVWGAFYHDQVVGPDTMPGHNNIDHKLSDIQFEKLRFFFLDPKPGFLEGIQPHSYNLEFPPKNVADFRLLFRWRRIQAIGGAGMFENQMMPALVELGAERATPENSAVLMQAEAGLVEPPPIRDGFRMLIHPDGMIEIAGRVLSKVEVAERMLITRLAPVV